MAYSIHQARTPQRQLPLFQAPGHIFGMSQADRLRDNLRTAQEARQGILNMYAAARAALGRANANPPSYRQAEKSRAFTRINLVRASLRANARVIDAAKAALLALVVVEAL